MRAALEEGLGALERIISTAEARRVDQMIDLAVRLAEEQDPAEAQEELRRTERLLKIMRTQRTLLIGAQAATSVGRRSLDAAVASAAMADPAGLTPACP